MFGALAIRALRRTARVIKEVGLDYGLVEPRHAFTTQRGVYVHPPSLPPPPDPVHTAHTRCLQLRRQAVATSPSPTHKTCCRAGRASSPRSSSQAGGTGSPCDGGGASASSTCAAAAPPRLLLLLLGCFAANCERLELQHGGGPGPATPAAALPLAAGLGAAAGAGHVGRAADV